ncbi:hypothetical protein F0562_034234 [Nyssa sinensis]|uniref:Chromo domain-containing protein n=1 Tax=Nyssa sinensis TaxID=561372 RepID=A0A5J5AIY8_9ASTE|nr:hypothetical protein F0562_034234 [Nyssa sinensis]
MAEGNIGTQYSQLADSLASVRQVQEAQQTTHESLQQTVDGLAQQLQVVATNLDNLVRQVGKRMEEPSTGRVAHNINPLFEDAGGIQTKAIRLEFPKFNGEDPNGWLYRANQFFNYHQPHPQHRVLLASVHMEGKAITWFQELESAGGFPSWESFVRALLIRFGPSAYEDPMEALTKLRQATTVDAYKCEFEYLSNQLHGLAEPYKLSCFLGGLREDIRSMVKMMQPQSLLNAFSLAKMQEENVAALKRVIRLSPGPIKPPMALPAPVQKAMVPVQRLSPAQMKERRDKGLCYNCDDKWAPGHRCKSAKLFIMECENSDEEDDIRSTPLAIEEGGSSSKQPSLDAQAQGPEPAISIHALAGSPNPRTMRIIGFIRGVQIVILLDTGSTHNFVDPSIITKARLPIYHTTGLNVKVANGEAVRSEGLTKPETFQINITLQGLNPTAMSLMEGEEFGKAAKTAKREPTGLPPTRTHDHHIELLEGTKPEQFLKGHLDQSKYALKDGLLFYKGRIYVEWWYNTNLHSSTKITPFEAVYGYQPPKLLSYSPGTTKLQAVDDILRSRDEILKFLQHNLQFAQARMKKYADMHRTERVFQIGDFVYLRLQPYHQQSLVHRQNLKLAPRFYGPYKILEKIGSVAYRLELPENSKIHPTFHVSCLKQHLGQRNIHSSTLPPIAPDGSCKPEPEEILQRRLIRKGNKAEVEVLVKWKGLPVEEASWAGFRKLQSDFPDLVDKVL